MVRVSKRQKLQRKGPTSKEVDISSIEHFQDPDPTDPNNITLKPAEVNCHEKLLIEQKLQVALTKIEDMNKDIRFLLNEVAHLKEDIHTIKNELNYRENSTEIIPSPSILSNPLISTSPSTSILNNNTKLARGPFPKYEPNNRVVPRPSSKDIVNTIGGKAHSLQFTCSLYVDLIERVLGPAQNSNIDYRAMVKEAILVTKAVVSNVKERHKIDPDLRWSYIDPIIKLEAYKKLEDATEHLLPLKLCSEFWGAHVLISNFWLKRKKTTKRKPYTSQKSEITNRNEVDMLSEISNEYTSPTENSSRDRNPQKKLKAFSIPFLTHP